MLSFPQALLGNALWRSHASLVASCLLPASSPASLPRRNAVWQPNGIAPDHLVVKHRGEIRLSIMMQQVVLLLGWWRSLWFLGRLSEHFLLDVLVDRASLGGGGNGDIGSDEERREHKQGNSESRHGNGLCDDFRGQQPASSPSACRPPARQSFLIQGDSGDHTEFSASKLASLRPVTERGNVASSAIGSQRKSSDSVVARLMEVVAW